MHRDHGIAHRGTNKRADSFTNKRADQFPNRSAHKGTHGCTHRYADACPDAASVQRWLARLRQDTRRRVFQLDTFGGGRRERKRAQVCLRLCAGLLRELAARASDGCA